MWEVKESEGLRHPTFLGQTPFLEARNNRDERQRSRTLR